jgi:holo-[acyl-carrier protein] synthase
MSVIGIGTDIVDIRRLEKMKPAVLEKLALRVLTTDEYDKFCALTFSVPYLAKRWAGKEAAAKALGTGIADGVSFQHFTILSLPSGQPTLVLSQRALEIAENMSATSWHITLSDEANYAVAFVVLSH